MIYLANNNKNIFVKFSIPIISSSIQTKVIDDIALLDTGFASGLYLSNKYKDLIKTKVFKTFSYFQYANGQEEKFGVYDTIIFYEGKFFQVETVFANITENLLGMQFLKLFNFNLQIAQNKVSLELAI